MKKFLKKVLPLVISAAMVLGIVGCSTNGSKEQTDANKSESNDDAQSAVPTDVLVINGLGDESISFTLDEVKAFEPYAKEIKSLTSSGEVKEASIVGATLTDMLESKGYSTANCDSIRIVASDGYEIAVPKDVIENKEIIIAYEENGEEYTKFGAFRSVIPDERAMYWVRGTVELNFEYSETVSNDIKNIVFMENMGSDIALEDYTYYESVDKAMSISSLIDTYVNIGSATSGAFVASDGLETEQTLDVLKAAYLKMTGENAPLFISPDMPKGMQVKGVKYFNVGDTCFASLSMLCASEETTELQSVLSDLGMTGASYLAIGTDGSETSLQGTAVSGSTFEAEGDAFYLVNDEESIKIEVKTIQQQ